GREFVPQPCPFEEKRILPFSEEILIDRAVNEHVGKSSKACIHTLDAGLQACSLRRDQLVGVSPLVLKKPRKVLGDPGWERDLWECVAHRGIDNVSPNRGGATRFRMTSVINEAFLH